MDKDEKIEFIKLNFLLSKNKHQIEGDKTVFDSELIRKIGEQVPHRLYKYRECNNNNLNALKNKKAWFSNPLTWNDKIDVTVTYDLEKDLQYIESHMDEFVIGFTFNIMNKILPISPEIKDFIISSDYLDFCHYILSDENELKKDKIISYLVPLVGIEEAKNYADKIEMGFATILNEASKRKMIDNLKKILSLNELKERMIVYSLSETFDNEHQWAMYADGGKGFCVGYLIKSKTRKEEDLVQNLLPIYYGDKEEFRLSEILEKLFLHFMDSRMTQSIVDELCQKTYISFLTKNEKWSAEQEWRFIVPIEQNESNLIDFDFAEVIYLGESISDYWKKRLLNIAKEHNLLVYQRKLDILKSKWIYEKVEI